MLPGLCANTEYSFQLEEYLILKNERNKHVMAS
jgi:hypothetical protein